MLFTVLASRQLPLVVYQVNHHRYFIGFKGHYQPQDSTVSLCMTRLSAMIQLATIKHMLKYQLVAWQAAPYSCTTHSGHMHARRKHCMAKAGGDTYTIYTIYEALMPFYRLKPHTISISINCHEGILSRIRIEHCHLEFKHS